MKNYLLCLFTLFSISLFSQSKSAISPIVGGDISWRVFYGDDLTGSAMWDEEKTNYRFGVNFDRQLTNKVWFKTGIRFEKVGFVDYHLTDLLWGSQIEAMEAILIDMKGTGEAKRTVDYSFLEIPAMIRFELLEGKWQPFFEIGISNHIYLRTKTVADIDYYSQINIKEREAEIRNYQFSGVISVGMNYVLTEKLKLFLQPAYRHFITSLDDTASDIHLLGLGVELGARLQLK